MKKERLGEYISIMVKLQRQKNVFKHDISYLEFLAISDLVKEGFVLQREEINPLIPPDKEPLYQISKSGEICLDKILNYSDKVLKNYNQPKRIEIPTANNNIPEIR